MKRTVKATALVLTGSLLVGGGWVLAQQMVSPEQVAARAEPPAPAPVLATLREGYLHGAMTVTATAASTAVHEVGAPKSLEGVVTASDLQVGAEVRAGDPVVRVNGRPVIVLTGPFPLYRDLTAGDSGDDVLMLQHALADAGLLRGTPDGVFGSRTAAAVRALYKATGFPVPTTTPPAPEASTPVDGDAPPPPPPAPQTMVSAAELAFTASLPARVTSVAQVGAPVEAGTVLVTLATGDVELVTQVPAESIGPLAVGATGVFTGDDDMPSQARVTAIDPAADGQVRVRWTLDGAADVNGAAAAVHDGGQYVLTVENPAAQTEQMLLAPVAAIVSRGGVDTVTAYDGTTFREVPVQVIATHGALAAIRADDDALNAGVEVRLA